LSDALAVKLCDNDIRAALQKDEEAMIEPPLVDLLSKWKHVGKANDSATLVTLAVGVLMYAQRVATIYQERHPQGYGAPRATIRERFFTRPSERNHNPVTAPRVAPDGEPAIDPRDYIGAVITG